MNSYVGKGIRRIPLHVLAYAGITGTAAYSLQAFTHMAHPYALAGLWGVGAAFLKELIEQVTVSQVWAEFWVDSLAQAGGAVLGVGAAYLGR